MAAWAGSAPLRAMNAADRRDAEVASGQAGCPMAVWGAAPVDRLGSVASRCPRDALP